MKTSSRSEFESFLSFCFVTFLECFLTQINDEMFSVGAYVISLVGYLIGTRTLRFVSKISADGDSSEFLWTLTGGSIGAYSLLVTHYFGVWSGIAWATFGPIFTVVAVGALSVPLFLAFERASYAFAKFSRCLRRVLSYCINWYLN